MRLPTGVWPIIVMDHPPSNVGGLHPTDHGIPFAVVLSARDWGLCASHECIEMLVDPTGNQTRSAPGTYDGLTLGRCAIILKHMPGQPPKQNPPPDWTPR